MKSALAGLLLAAAIFGLAAWRTQPQNPGYATQSLIITFHTPIQSEELP